MFYLLLATGTSVTLPQNTLRPTPQETRAAIEQRIASGDLPDLGEFRVIGPEEYAEIQAEIQEALNAAIAEAEVYAASPEGRAQAEEARAWAEAEAARRDAFLADLRGNGNGRNK